MKTELYDYIRNALDERELLKAIAQEAVSHIDYADIAEIVYSDHSREIEDILSVAIADLLELLPF